MATVLEYRRTTRRQAEIDLGHLGGMLSGGLAFLLGAIFLLRLEWRHIWIGVGLFALLWFGIFGLVIAYRRAKAEFVCRLDETSLRCVSPVIGPSFEIALADIVRVESEINGLGNTERHLVLRDGRRFLLTTNYGNPAWEFARKICELTGVPEVEA